MARGIAHREWVLHRDDYQTDEAFRAAVQNELALAEHIGERLGVAIVAAPIRTRALGAGPHFTTGWVFRTATVPSAADQKPPEVEPEATEEMFDFDVPEVEQPA